MSVSETSFTFQMNFANAAICDGTAMMCTLYSTVLHQDWTWEADIYLNSAFLKELIKVVVFFLMVQNKEQDHGI